MSALGYFVTQSVMTEQAQKQTPFMLLTSPPQLGQDFEHQSSLSGRSGCNLGVHAVEMFSAVNGQQWDVVRDTTTRGHSYHLQACVALDALDVQKVKDGVHKLLG